MCGIAGFIGKDGIPLNFERILNELRHRGPDSSGHVTLKLSGKTVWLGHTRLSILDLTESGHQPMRSNNGSWWASYNGEIYNHLDLRSELDCSFRGHSDTETLIEYLSEFGINKSLPRLNGMFAFASLDMVQNRLYLVRDPFGIKPLYYVNIHDGWAFASEVRALRAMGVPQEIDGDALDVFLTLRYIPSPRTLWKGIFRVPPGHFLCYDLETERFESTCYIKPTKERFEGTLEGAIAGYRDVLGSAVKRQLLSDVPVGVFLSGGIDSALIAAMAAESGRELKAFTVGFGKQHPECEIEEAADTAKVIGLPHNFIEVTPEALLQAIPDIVGAVEEPLGTTSVLPMWYLAHRARKDVTVVLTGQGSDEPWGGYPRYQLELWRKHIPRPELWSSLYSLKKLWHGMPETLERGLRSLPVADETSRFKEEYSLFNREERLWLTGCDNGDEATFEIASWLSWVDDEMLAPAERMMRIDSRMNLADDLLLYGDKISMAASLEARVPMLDIEVVRFIESLPLSFRVGIRHTKIVHKMMAESYLPEQIVHRPKKGFRVPFTQWSKGPWREWIEAILLDRNAPHFNLLDHAGISRIWKEHLSARPDRSRQIFALLMLALVFRQTDQNHLRFSGAAGTTNS
ncbi:MAG: asparagine synthase (glutamine-hydrolyzing) [Nitrospirae bacterium]|nr:asparagine synthase (glutamine-hydrolyzing) [Nitrospirota bacterium]